MTEAKREALRAWRKANPEKLSALRRKERLAHPEKLEVTRTWRKANPERCRANRESWRKRNAEKKRGIDRRWRAENPAVNIPSNQRHRARKAAAGGEGITRKQWLEVVGEYGGRCAYCGRAVRLSMDHVEPLSKGGAHDISNAAPACSSCNSSKNDRQLVVWLAVRAA